jgi:hypothetical protein
MSGGILGAESVLARVIENGKLVLLGCIGSGIVVFLIAAAVLRIEEFYLVTDHLLAKVKGFRRRKSTSGS